MTTAVASTPDLSKALAEVRAKWGWFVALGLVLVVLGLCAAVHLFAATVATVFYVGALMLLGGAIHFFQAFRVKGWGNVLFWSLSGLLYAASGVIAFMNPLLASAVLTLFLAAALTVAGVFRAWAGFKAKSHEGWGWIVTGGVVTLLAGLIILLGWPVNSLWVLGILLAVDLTFQGWSLVACGLALKAKNVAA